MSSATSKPASSKRGHWSTDLLKSMKNPAERIKEDDLTVVLKDKYPKAEFHYLILPKENIQTIRDVGGRHRDLLLHMHKVARELVDEHAGREFMTGYHAMPSMQRLHMHVISTDFVSPHLKTRHHWNTFTTPFFLHSSDVCRQVCETGEVSPINEKDCEIYLQTKLKCHKCPNQLKNMNELKRHLLTHVSKTHRSN